MQIFTLGYQGLSLDNYIQNLLSAGVGMVCDVREVPWSYNRKYIKSVLQNNLENAGIEYRHLKSCGNPSSNRKTAKSIEECLSRYRQYLQENSDCLDLLLKQIQDAAAMGKSVCLTCFERSHHDCHRTILLEYLCEKAEFEIIHLNSEICYLPKIAILPHVSDTTIRPL